MVQGGYYVAAVVSKTIFIASQSSMNTIAVFTSIIACQVLAFLSMGTALVWSGERWLMTSIFNRVERERREIVEDLSSLSSLERRAEARKIGYGTNRP